MATKISEATKMVKLMEIKLEQLTKPLMAKLIKLKDISLAIFSQGYLVLVQAINLINSKIEDQETLETDCQMELAFVLPTEYPIIKGINFAGCLPTIIADL